MKILYLGPKNENIIAFLKNDNNTVVQQETKIKANDLIGIDYIVSYGYRYIIEKSIVDRFYQKAINLHISYLPWNRGADPNLWSFFNDTPKGVTIHYISSGLDTGDIIIQDKIEYDKEDTLKTSYDKLQNCIEKLFCSSWHEIKRNKVQCKRQSKYEGSYHRSIDKNIYLNLLTDGWNTKVIDILGKVELYE